jgi:hypothetical protein
MHFTTKKLGSMIDKVAKIQNTKKTGATKREKRQ